MILVIYEANTLKVISKHENVINPIIEGSTVKWEGGSLGGIKLPFLLLEATVAVSDPLTSDVIQQDKKAGYYYVDLRKENETLKQELAQTNADLMGLMDYVFGT